MAPADQRNRRDGATAASLAGGVSTILLVLSWCLVVGWWLAPSGSRLAGRLQPLAWIPDWAWLLGVAGPASAAAIVSCRAATLRRLRLAMAAAALIGPGLGVLGREYGVRGPLPAPFVRVLFLNAQSSPATQAEGEVAMFEALDPDLVIIANPGWLAPTWRRSAQEASIDGRPRWFIHWRNPVLAASPHGACVIRTVMAVDDIRVVSVEPPPTLAARLGIDRILVVDLPSDPGIDREAVVDRLEAGLAKSDVATLDSAGLVLGDFNMTPRTPALIRVRGRLRDLVSEGARGWMGTWPRERPVLRIDQVFGDVRRNVRIETFDPGWGGHRGFVIDIDVDEGATDGRPDQS